MKHIHSTLAKKARKFRHSTPRTHTPTYLAASGHRRCTVLKPPQSQSWILYPFSNSRFRFGNRRRGTRACSRSESSVMTPILDSSAFQMLSPLRLLPTDSINHGEPRGGRRRRRRRCCLLWASGWPPSPRGRCTGTGWRRCRPWPGPGAAVAASCLAAAPLSLSPPPPLVVAAASCSGLRLMEDGCRGGKKKKQKQAAMCVWFE